MTRVNVVPPQELTDQHLIAEYRELLMIPAGVRLRTQRDNPIKPEEIPPKFTLNKGHVKFFFDKGEYLRKRYLELIEEMKNRGFKPDPSRVFPIEDFPEHLRNDWTPTVEAERVARHRINLRISQKPHWYKYCGKPLEYG